MNLDVAARIIAGYLAGGPATRAELMEACKAVNADEDCLAVFSREFGLGGPPESTCAKFDANVAELAEMPVARREREMPELARHAKHCPRCRRVYWQVRGLWTSRAAIAVAAEGRRIVRMLAEGIRLALNSAGEIVEFGLGPPWTVLHPTAAAVGGAVMGEPLAGAAARTPADLAGQEQEWLLEDEISEEGDETSTKYQVQIRIRVRGSAQRKTLLWCNVAGLPDLLISRASLDVSGRKRPPAHRTQGAPYYFKDKLAAYQSNALVLPEGEFTIRIELEGTVPPVTWEIPLSLGRGEQK